MTSHKHGFTLIEMLIVLVIIGMLMAMTVSRFHGQRERIDVMLAAQQREDAWSRMTLQMREGRRYDSATISLSTTGVSIQRIGGLLSGGEESITFSEPLIVNVLPASGTDTTRTMGAYDIGCQGLGSGSIIVLQRPPARMCYTVDTTICALQKIICSLP